MALPFVFRLSQLQTAERQRAWYLPLGLQANNCLLIFIKYYLPFLCAVTSYDMQ